MKMGRRHFRDILMIGVIALIGLGAVGTAYMEKRHDAKIDAIMTGEVRGNKDSMIFHVPTCPEYGAIKESNLRPFATVWLPC